MPPVPAGCTGTRCVVADESCLLFEYFQNAPAHPQHAVSTPQMAARAPASPPPPLCETVADWDAPPDSPEDCWFTFALFCASAQQTSNASTATANMLRSLGAVFGGPMVSGDTVRAV